MFSYCENFNQTLNEWDVSEITNLNSMFKNCLRYNQPLDKWNLKCRNISEMFFDCYNFVKFMLI